MDTDRFKVSDWRKMVHVNKQNTGGVTLISDKADFRKRKKYQI